ncbi:MAG: tetratricopeptide repeat protein, partial [Planctomycetales bacterium]|nr:tetratricopeptide repeat protein [Planctomycetales bacterium]
SLAFYVLALLAKTSVVMLPPVLLLVWWWKERRVGWAALRATLPFFLVTIPLALVTIVLEHYRSAGEINVRPEGTLSIVAGVGWQLWFYLYKAFVPLSVSPLYPRWTINAASATAWAPLLLYVAAVGAAWKSRAHSVGKAALAILTYYALVLFPTFGLFGVSYHAYSLVADHWQHLALVGVAISVAAGLHWAIAHSQGVHRQAVCAAAAAVVTVLAGLSWTEATHYHDLESWANHILATNPDASVAHAQLAAAMRERGDLDGAVAHWQKALQLAPEYLPVYATQASLASALLDQGDAAACVDLCRKAIEERPQFAPAHICLADALVQQGFPREAEGVLQTLVDLQPDQAVACSKLGLLAGDRGADDESLRYARQAAALDPSNAEFQYRLACAHERRGEATAAMDHYRQSIALSPSHAAACNNLASALLAQGNQPEARRLLMQAVAAAPDFAPAQYNLGLVEQQRGEIELAESCFRLAMAADPGHQDARRRLIALYNAAGTQFARQKDWSQARRQFAASIALAPDQALVHANLGICLARLGDDRAALAQFDEALAQDSRLELARRGRASVAGRHSAAATPLR